MTYGNVANNQMPLQSLQIGYIAIDALFIVVPDPGDVCYPNPCLDGTCIVDPSTTYGYRCNCSNPMYHGYTCRTCMISNNSSSIQGFPTLLVFFTLRCSLLFIQPLPKPGLLPCIFCCTVLHMPLSEWVAWSQLH